MEQIQDGISEYNIGITALDNKQYAKAQKHLKNAEKKLNRGKISQDGLNFARGNLIIANLATEEKRGVGQAKRYLKYLTKSFTQQENGLIIWLLHIINMLSCQQEKIVKVEKEIGKQQLRK